MTAVSLEAQRLAQECSGMNPEAYTRAAAAPIDPPAEYALEVMPEDDIIAAHSMTTWYLRSTEDSMEQAALYVARRFGLSFAHAWDQVECSFADYESQYSHN